LKILQHLPLLFLLLVLNVVSGRGESVRGVVLEGRPVLGDAEISGRAESLVEVVIELVVVSLTWK
jgi:hypothetical protein